MSRRVVAGEARTRRHRSGRRMHAAAAPRSRRDPRCPGGRSCTSRDESCVSCGLAVSYARTMEHARFWSIIDEARSTRGQTSAALERALNKLPARDILGFDAWMWAYYTAIRREDLWAAVSAIRDGCGDDGFD